MVAIVGEVGLSLEALILDHDFVVEAGSLILRLKRPKVLFLAVHHD